MRKLDNGNISVSSVSTAIDFRYTVKVNEDDFSRMTAKKMLIGYMQGAFLPISEIRIDPHDLGFLRGYAAFDVMPTVNGKPFLPERHYARLVRSAAALGLALPVDEAGYSAILETLIRKNAGTKLSFRTVISGGPSENGFMPDPGRETFLVLAEEIHAIPSEYYEHGVNAVTLEYERPMPHVKLANHAIAIADLPRRQAAGAYEAIYVCDGQVSEASQSNVFVVKDGRLATTWDNVLLGITQGLVIELSEQAGQSVEKRNISLQELFEADEVFITGSSKRIVPLIRIDGTVIGTGRPGKITQELMTALERFMRNY